MYEEFEIYKQIDGKFYTIYKITNTIDGMCYYGAHSTTDLDDGYIGSSKNKHYWNARNKYGEDAFIKEYLFFLENDELMYKKEAEILNPSFLLDNKDKIYNLIEGGTGFTSYNAAKLWDDPDIRKIYIETAINNWKNPEYREMMSQNNSKIMKEKWNEKEFREHRSKKNKETSINNWKDPEFRRKMSIIQKESYAERIKDPNYKKMLSEKRSLAMKKRWAKTKVN